MSTDSQWSKQKACFARATRMWLAVNHNTSVTSGECIRDSMNRPKMEFIAYIYILIQTSEIKKLFIMTSDTLIGYLPIFSDASQNFLIGSFTIKCTQLLQIWQKFKVVIIEYHYLF